MCCFSGPVRRVSKTRIFARPIDGARQLLVYSMSLVVDADVAMVLPIPVPSSSPEGAVRFVDMSSCPSFFDRIDSLFPAELARGGTALGGSFSPQSAPLVVHEVGDFEASFVPSRADFERLDARFRLPGHVWDALPTYTDWGFCVFKLRATVTAPRPEAARRGLLARLLAWPARSHSNAVVSGPPSTPRDHHPMAFEFPRRDPTRLFFPTVHVHDGMVHATARFDHTLYFQMRAEGGAVTSTDPGVWERSASTPEVAPSVGDAARWLDRGAHAYRRHLSGNRPNRDIYVDQAKRSSQ